MKEGVRVAITSLKIAFAVCFSLCLPACVWASKGVVLKATIQHSSRLQPVETGLMEGNTFDSKVLSKYTPLNTWYKIPKWSSGRWHGEQQTAISSRNELSGIVDATSETFNCRGDEDWGKQLDSRAQIWEWSHVPYMSESEMDDAISYSLVRKCVPVSITDAQIVMKFESVSVLVAKTSKLIISSVQKESIQTYVPQGEDQMKVDASIRSFDDHGFPKRTSTTVSTVTRTSPFRPANDYQGQNLRILFRRFLTDTGQLDLLP